VTPYAELTDRGGYDTDELDSIAAAATYAPIRGLHVCVSGGYQVGKNPASRKSAGYVAEGIVYASGGRVLWRTTLTNQGGRDPVAIVRAKCEAWIAADETTRARMALIDRYKGGERNRMWRKFGVTAA
jgi:hypothetical protein